MTEQLDSRIRRLVAEIHASAPPAPPAHAWRNGAATIELDDGASRHRSVPTRVIAVSCAALVVAVATLGLVRLSEDDRGAAGLPAPSAASTSDPAGPAVTSTAPPSVSDRLLVESIEGSERVAIDERSVDGRRCIVLVTASNPDEQLACDDEDPFAGMPPGNPGRMGPRLERSAGRVVMLGIHDPSVAAVVLTIDGGLHREMIETVQWEAGRLAVALVLLSTEVSDAATSYTTEVFDEAGQLMSTGGGTIPTP